jgi:hypothetical protein
MITADELLGAERRVWQLFPTGQVVDFLQESVQEVRAEVVVALLCEAVSTQPGHVGRLALRGAVITGMIDLREAEPKYALWLDRCDIKHGIDLTGVKTQTVWLTSCNLGPARLAGVSIDGDLSFRNTQLQGAELGGESGPALIANGLTVSGGMFCDGDFRCDSEISLVRASIGGVLNFGGAQLDGKGGPALNADGLTVTRNMFCSNGFKTDGEVRLAGARIGGELNFSGAELGGEIRLGRASIGDQLNFQGAHLNGKDGLALAAYRLTVSGDMLCDKGFVTDGTVRLVSTSIGGQLNFQGAQIAAQDAQVKGQDAQVKGQDGLAVDAYRLTVSGDMICNNGFRTDGVISLVGASIGGQLNFKDAQLDGKNGLALDAYRLTVSGDMSCDGRFHAVGTTSLVGASIGRQLNFRGAQLKGIQLDGKDGLALAAYRLTVSGDMFCDEGFRADGKINLSGAKVGVLVDDKASWPCDLELDGFSYSDLKPHLEAKERLTRLRLRRSPFRAQPYQQLAAYYRQQGHDRQARLVLLARQRAHTRQQSWWARWWGWLQDGLVGYGYVPERAFTLLALAFILGWEFFRAHHPPPVKAQGHPSFNAALYTLDLLIPAPGLGRPATGIRKENCLLSLLGYGSSAGYWPSR